MWPMSHVQHDPRHVMYHKELTELKNSWTGSIVDRNEIKS